MLGPQDPGAEIPRTGTETPRDTRPQVSRHEEELRSGTEARERNVRVRKRVETEHFEDMTSRMREHAEAERAEPYENDSGEIETLPDGSLSIPVMEEEIVVTKRVVVRERIIVRKQARMEPATVSADLRRERVEIVPEGDAEVETESPPP